MNAIAMKEIPDNMSLIEHSDYLEFEYSWFKPKYVATLISVPVFVLFLVGSDFIPGDFNEPTTPVYLLLLTALVIIYYALAKTANRTNIHVTHDQIVIKHGPIPFAKNLKLQKRNVAQLYVTRHRTGHRYYLYSATYQINVLLKSGEVDTLVRGLHSADQCTFIERKIESFFDITDVHIEGELSKG